MRRDFNLSSFISTGTENHLCNPQNVNSKHVYPSQESHFVRILCAFFMLPVWLQMFKKEKEDSHVKSCHHLTALLLHQNYHIVFALSMLTHQGCFLLQLKL